MSTGTLPLNHPQVSTMHTCAKCGMRYSWPRSSSALKMTYCTSLCEFLALGFTIDELLNTQRAT